MDQQTKKCQNCKQQFTIEPDDFDFYKKMGVPAPGLCPDCRMKRKLVWRNERTFYNRICDMCGKSIITIYHPRYPAPVYCFNCWISDKWDPHSYGAGYDLSRPFFEQFAKLLKRVPKMATYIGTGEGAPNVNSEYINFAGGNKNCYLVFSSAQNEDCSYSRGLRKSKDVVDMYFSHMAEYCYEGINVNNSNNVVWSQTIYDSLDSLFCLNCVGVQNCFGCVNLLHKKYHFFNEPLKKDEYEKRVQEIKGSYQKMKTWQKKFEQFSRTLPRRENNNKRSVNSSGEYIFESKNCQSCFEVFNSEDCKYVFSIKVQKDSYDMVGRGLNAELFLETVASGHGGSRVIGSWAAEGSHNIEYSYDVRSCEYCIGCVGLRHGKYSILNKQYSKEEYEKIRDRIIEELKKHNYYGLYFPPELSPWAYNETLAHESYPLSKKEARAHGFRWEDDIPRTRGKETLKSEDLPDHINDVADTIGNETLACIECGYNYRLIPSELAFYKRMILPIPRKCFNCRYLDRLRRRGPFTLYARTCDKCGKAIQTTYAPERKEIVYCEACYKQEVV
ncbi:hypothetical protein MYX07_06245 [Patescibacteria group bacterium AH-259-L07]|nr:hypothetical protein [Patescibacteria group bacterium AH-259-L07]